MESSRRRSLSLCNPYLPLQITETMYKKLSFGLFLMLNLMFITSCDDGPQVQINSECFLPDLSISMQQPIDKLDLDFSVFTDYVDDPSEGYAKFTHSDSIFESWIHIFDSSLPDWRVGELTISREIEMKKGYFIEK